MFAVFFPVAWPTRSANWIADPSGRTCIVSLVNAHDRPFRLKLKAGKEMYAIYRYQSGGPCFGYGFDVGLLLEGCSCCFPSSFQLDTEAESKADLPPLPFAYDKTLLLGVVDGKWKAYSYFFLTEMECYTLDA